MKWQNGVKEKQMSYFMQETQLCDRSTQIQHTIAANQLNRPNLILISKMEKLKLVGTFDTSQLTNEEYHTFARLLRKVRVTSIKMLQKDDGFDAEATESESDQEEEQSMETDSDVHTENKNNPNDSTAKKCQTQGATVGDNTNDDLPDIGSLKLVFEPSDDFWAAGRNIST